MPPLEALQLKEYATFGIALLGAVLGIMNTWNAISQKRVRLRVRPLLAIPKPNGANMFCIEVVNLSAFSVVIHDVGFTTNWRGVRKGRRLAVLSPILHDGKPWPRRLESRDAVSVYFPPGDVVKHSKRIRKAYARTACGEVAYGASPALKQLRDAITTIQ